MTHDVLFILDCPASGGAFFSSIFPPQQRLLCDILPAGARQEVLAACAFNASTPKPGPTCFTRLLGEELRARSKDGVSTEKLLVEVLGRCAQVFVEGVMEVPSPVLLVAGSNEGRGSLRLGVCREERRA